MNTIDSMIESLPDSRQGPFAKLYEVINTHLPAGFESQTNEGGVHFVVPLSMYPDGYHCTPNTPLPFITLVSRKNFIALYHMGLYADEELLAWFQSSYADQAKYKLDMGKSCVRMKRMDDIPYELIGELCQRVSMNDWIERYEAAIKK